MVFGPDGNLYVSANATDSVLRYDATSGAFLGAFVPAGSGGFDGAAGIAFGPDGHLYVLSVVGAKQALRYDGATGAFLDVFVPEGSGGMMTPVALLFTAEAGGGTPPPPAGPWLTTAGLPGFRFKILIDGDRTGSHVADCVPQTLCIAGAIPTRAELFVRIIGPRPNGKLWVQAVRFTVSRVELWVEQASSGEINYYELQPLAASTAVLPGVNDSLAFDPP
jgi:hypothetical protein